MNSYKIFTNKECKYYPCHKLKRADDFNCLFCYCPLYFIKCPGVYRILPNGDKDCSGCTIPHEGKEAWDIMAKYLRLEYNKGKTLKK